MTPPVVLPDNTAVVTPEVTQPVTPTPTLAVTPIVTPTIPELGNPDWEVRYRCEKLGLLQPDALSTDGDKFATLDYSHLPYELAGLVGLHKLSETAGDLGPFGLFQFQSGPMQMVSEIDLDYEQTRRPITDLATPQAEIETHSSAGNDPSFQRDIASCLLAILLVTSYRDPAMTRLRRWIRSKRKE